VPPRYSFVRVRGSIRGGCKMDAIEHSQIEAETKDSATTERSSPFQEICPRHGAKVHRYHGCPQCVIEEVRRHERRMDPSFMREVPNPGSFR
jgi:hypothetical protein